MPFQLSPGVQVIEKDFSSIVPAVSSSTGAFAGPFAWGPVGDPIRVSSETELVARFGTPEDANAASFFTAANFLSYTNSLFVCRTDAAALKNAATTLSSVVESVTLTNAGSGYVQADTPTVTFSAPQLAGGVAATGTVTSTVAGGNRTITGITITNAGSGYTSVPTVTISAPTSGVTATATATITLKGAKINNVNDFLDDYQVDTGVHGELVAKFPGAYGNGLKIVMIDAGNWALATSAIKNAFTAAPGTSTFASDKGISNDEVHVLVFDTPDGRFSGTPNAVLEKYSFLSKLKDAKRSDGTNIFWKSVLNAQSKYVWALGSPAVNKLSVVPTSVVTGTALNFDPLNSVGTVTLVTAGSGYVEADTPTVTFSAPPAGGTTATGTVVSSVAGGVRTITGITITNAGSGYTSAPTVTISAPASGTAATATSTLLSTNRIVITATEGSGAATSLTAFKTFFDAAPDKLTTQIQVTGATTAGNNKMYTVTAVTFTSPSTYVIEVAQTVTDETSTTGAAIVGVAKSDWNAMSSSVLGMTGNKTFKVMNGGNEIVLSGGVTDLTPTAGQIQSAYGMFTNTDEYDISLIATGNVSATVAAWVVDNVAEVRKDCVVFISPNDNLEPITGFGQDATDKIIAYRNALDVSSSYAVMDSGFKYQYDRYNDMYRWVPLNGDIAGLCARTDFTADPWFSPGGYTRGQIKNIVKLAFNPSQADRDVLYPAGVNPVVTFPGQGTVLFGDKTLLAKPSAFDRINVRRLFIVLEKSIATAAKFQLFEFNDSFTRAQFRNLVEPFLRDVQGRRGIIDFRVKCDETNNSGEVIDRNEFVADIFIKPNRSINFITLNFIAARSSVSFEEIGA